MSIPGRGRAGDWRLETIEPRRSGIKVSLPAEYRRQYAAVIDEAHRRPRRIGRVQRRSLVGGDVMRIEELESDVELLHRIPLRAGTNFPEGVVGVAAVARIGSDRR